MAVEKGDALRGWERGQSISSLDGVDKSVGLEKSVGAAMIFNAGSVAINANGSL
jgi:hypothetical protein